MASIGSVIDWDDHGLLAGLIGVEPYVKYQMRSVAEKINSEGISYMKNNAPWTDQTGAARNGLNGQVFSDDDGVAIVFYHSVFYGIFLELKNSGKYAIINPTIQVMGPKAIQMMEHIL